MLAKSQIPNEKITFDIPKEMNEHLIALPLKHAQLYPDSWYFTFFLGIVVQSLKQNNRKRMPKQVIISMEEMYPFGECEQYTSDNTRVLVRKIFTANLQQRKLLMEKAKIMEGIHNDHMIKIESVMEENDSIFFFYEYVPIKVETWISNINDQFIENFKDQLIKFSSFLVHNNISTVFQLENIGMDHKYQAKYFLNINFEINTTLSKDKLKSNYIKQISSLFKPYLEESKSGRSSSSDQSLIGSDQLHKQMIRQEMGAEKNQNTKLNTSGKSRGYQLTYLRSKDKALERYYQEANMSVDYPNQQLLKEFINVLDDEEQETQIFSDSLPQDTFVTKMTSTPREHHQNGLFTPKSSTLSKRDTTSFSTSHHIVSSLQSPKLSFSDPPQPIQTLKFMKSCSIGRDSIEYPQYGRSSIQIQTRVKTMIQKSKTAIRKFKEISWNNVRR